MLNKLKNSQKGVSLIITFFIMLVILFSVLSISALLFSEVKVIRNIGNSMVSFYAADSGIEKVLYYDRQVLPGDSDRGLCAMLDETNNSDNYCSESGAGDPSIYCISPTYQTGDDNPIDGCNYNVCNDCTISFNTTFENRNYNVKARVYPNGSFVNFEIDSTGVYPINGGASRKIQISITP